MVVWALTKIVVAWFTTVYWATAHNFILYRFFEYEIVLLPAENSTWALKEQHTDFGSTTSYAKVYKSWLVVVVLFIIPLTLLFTFTCCILVSLKRSASRVRTGSDSVRSRTSSRSSYSRSSSVRRSTRSRFTFCQLKKNVFNIIESLRSIYM
jgi:hypothetical protein